MLALANNGGGKGMSEFENLLIQHCSPTLLGIKQANLFSFEKEKLKAYLPEIYAYRQRLQHSGISIEFLYCCSKRIFVMVYHKDRMIQYLQSPDVRTFLEQEGYPSHPDIRENFDRVLLHLKARTNNFSEFPHEIGFFLGYPKEDVFSFIYEKGKNYKFYGYWKVYGDESKAKKIFQLYENCRNILFQKVTAGVPMLKLLGAA